MKTFRNIYIALFALLITGSVLAQNNQADRSSELMPKEGNFGASIIVDGLIDNLNLNSVNTEYGQNILFVKYYLEDDLALRAGFGLNVNSASRKTADSVNLTLVSLDSSLSQSVFNISFGLEKHLSPNKRLDPYLFSQIDLTFIGKTTFEINSSIEGAAGKSTVDRTIKQDGGIALGLSAGFGMNYFIGPRISLGAEVGVRLNYSSVGGTISDNQVINPLNGNSTTNFVKREDKINTIEIGVRPEVLINLSYYF